jgi:hypothetical protein
MKSTKKILLILAILSIGVFSCKKSVDTSYSKDALTLSVAKVGSTELLTWTKVNTSDFKRYEIFGSSTPDIDIVKGTANLIGTITDPEKTTFEASDVLPDSSNGLVLQNYYKVAVVLQDRKVGSNTITKSSDIVFATNSNTLLGSLSKAGLIYFFNSNNFNDVDILDLATLTKKTVSNVAVSSFQNSGTDVNGNYEIMLNGGSNIVYFYDAKTLQFSHSLIDNNVMFLDIKMNLGKLCALVYDQVNGQYMLNMYNISGQSYNKVASIAMGASNFNKLELSNDGSKLIASSTNFNNGASIYSVTGNTFTTILSNSNISLGSVVMNNNATKMVNSAGVVFDGNLNQLSSLNNSSTFGTYLFANNDNSIVFNSQNAPNQITVFNAADYTLSNSINLTTKSGQIFGSTMIPFNGSLFVISQIFNNITGTQKTVVFKKSL